MRRSSALTCALVGAALILTPPAAAQQPAGTPGLDSLVALVPWRPGGAIQDDLRRAEDAVRTASYEVESTRLLRSRAETRRKAMESEIDQIKDRLDRAKDEKREADRQALEIELKAAEAGKKTLEEREALREAEIELAEAERRLAEARVKALGLELQLERRRGERAMGLATSLLEASRQQRVLRDLERQTLEAMRDEARRQKDLADRSLRVVERKLKLFQAQARLLPSG